MFLDSAPDQSKAGDTAPLRATDPARDSPSELESQHSYKLRSKFSGLSKHDNTNLPAELHMHTVLGELDMYITYRLNLVGYYENLKGGY